MRFHSVLALGAVLVTVASLPGTASAQRQRVPDREGASEPRTAREREPQPTRTAQERVREAPAPTPEPPPAPAPEPPPAPAPEPPPAPAAPNRETRVTPERGRDGSPDGERQRGGDDRDRGDRDHGRRDQDEGGSVRVGRPIVVGIPIVVGHPNDEPHYSSRRRSGKSFSSVSTFVDDTIEFGAPTTTFVEIDDVHDVTQADVGRADLRRPLSEASIFTPWFSVTERITAGLPLTYPEAYANTYDKAEFTSSLDAPVQTEPGTPPLLPDTAIEPGAPLVPYAPGTFGGLTFDISPGDAGIYVEGLFVGTSDDYPPDGAPLPLPIGVHKIEVRSRGFVVERFEITVMLGHVIPLRGSLAPAR
jgi:hypothetical protein